MRKSLSALVLALAAASAAQAQFITDLRPHRPPQPMPDRRFAPIVVESHKVDVAMNDGVARTTVNLVFRNPNGVQLEGSFMFPIPDEAAVANFAMSMGGKMVQGEVLEKDKAAGIYQSIVQRQLDPGLLEYVGRRLFQAKVFPIPPSGTTEVELKYDEPLRRDGLTVEYRYPFRTRAATGAPVAKASFKAEIRTTDPVLTVYSPTHEIDVVKKGDHEARVSYERGSEPGDRDIVIAYGLSKGAVGATLFTHAEGQDEGAFLLLLAPSSEIGAGAVVAKDVVFVVDTSGSMAGEKIAQTKKALEYCINSLGAGDRFNLVTFATEAQPLFEGLAAADEANRKKALAAVGALVARGGTNINDALVSALGMSRDKDRPFQIIFMTDGEPTIGVTATEGILGNVKQANKALTRLFVFGVGEELKVDLLDLLAEQNHGSRDYVGGKENIETRISSFFDKVSSPVLSETTIEFERVTVKERYPQILPDIFRGSQLLVTGRYQGKGTGIVRLKGKVNGKPVEHVFELPFKGGDETTAFVPRLWAVRKVGYLMDQIRLNGENKELKDEVVRLGKTYGIVTPYTSYLVVEDVVAGGRVGGERLGRGDTGRAGGGPGGYSGPPGGGAPGGGTWGPTGSATPGGSGGAAPAPGRARGGTTELKKAAPGAPAPDPATGTSVTPPPADYERRGLGEGSDAKPNETDRYVEDLAKKSADEAQKQRRAQDEPAPKPGLEFDPANQPRTEPEAKDARDKLEAAENFRRGYFTDAIALSKAVKSLRESQSGEDAVSGAFVRRVANRTFYQRSGLFVEAPVLDLAPEAIQKKLVRVEVFSKEYFALLQAKPELAKVLALGQSVLFVDGERIVQIVPAGVLPKPASETAEPAKDAPPK